MGLNQPIFNLTRDLLDEILFGHLEKVIKVVFKDDISQPVMNCSALDSIINQMHNTYEKV